MAKQHLDYTAFSCSGLISQLRYEGIHQSVATGAVYSLGVTTNRGGFRVTWPLGP